MPQVTTLGPWGISRRYYAPSGNIAPVAAFSTTASGRTVTVTDSSTDSDGTIARRVWSMGDGTTYDSTTLAIPNPFAHTYASNGTYTITLTVTDDLGLAGGVSHSSGALTGVTRTAVTYDYPMPGVDNQRTSRTPSVIASGDFKPKWYIPLDSYIPTYMSLIAVNNVLFVPTAHGIEAIDAFGINNSEWTTNNISKPWRKWTFATAMPVGNAPTYYAANGFLYFGCTDGKLYCLDAATGTEQWSYQVDSGILCNPVVVSVSGNHRVIFSSRLGTVYSLDATTGALVWKLSTGTGQPVSTSPSYYGASVYVVGADNRIHKIAAATGVQSWQSEVLGLVMHNFWVVPYTHPTLGDRIIVSGGLPYRQKLDPSPQGNTDVDGNAVSPLVHKMEQADVMPENTAPVDLQRYGTAVTWSTATHGSALWADGTTATPTQRVLDYFADPTGGDAANGLDRHIRKPYRQGIIALKDSDGTRAEKIPALWHGTKSGGRYPVVLGNDNLIYAHGWNKFSRVGGQPGIPWANLLGYDLARPDYAVDITNSNGMASDEPQTHTVTADRILYLETCDREIGYTIPYSTAAAYFSNSPVGNNIYTYCPNYNKGGEVGYTYDDGDMFGSGNTESWGGYDGAYGKHGYNAPPIPHDGRIYVRFGSSIVCMEHSAPAVASTEFPHVPLPIRPAMSAAQPSTAALTTRLETAISAVISAGRLTPAFTPTHGLANDLIWTRQTAHAVPMVDYFADPAQLAIALIQARAYVSGALQTAIDTYLVDMWTNYRPGNVGNTGFATGTRRDNWITLPTDITALMASETPQATIDATGGPFGGGTGSAIDRHRNPIYWYALWLYYNAGINPSYTAANAITHGGSLTTRTTDAKLLLDPELLHAYLAGWFGYKSLLAAAGSSPTAADTEYARLLALWNANFTIHSRYDVSQDYAPAGGGTNNNARLRQLNGARHGMWLVPDVATAYASTLTSGYTTAVAHYTQNVVPYWFASGFGVGYNECADSCLYDRTWSTVMRRILGYSREALTPYVDVPYGTGDPVYIENVVNALTATPTFADPTAAFTYHNNGDTSATFTNTSAPVAPATFVDYRWDFGDGTYSTLRTPPPHIFGVPGGYTVMLRVTDSNGIYDEVVYTVTVTGASTSPPSVDAATAAVTTYNNGGSTESKVTVTVTVTSNAATAPWFFYDAAPPTGVVAQTGCSVDLVVQAPDSTTFTIPCYWMQPFVHTTHADSLASNTVHDHFLPTIDAYDDAVVVHTYKGHFTPNATGTWTYYVTATDAYGSDSSSTATVSVAVVGSGLINISPNDTRYFQYGRSLVPFLGFGYNQDNNHGNVGAGLILDEPETVLTPEWALASSEGVSLLRLWLSAQSIYDSPWNPVSPRLPATAIPQNLIRNTVPRTDGGVFTWQMQAVSTSESFFSPGLVIGVSTEQYRLACEQSTTYQFTITYMMRDNFTIAPSPGTGNYGLVLKTMTTTPSLANIISNSTGTHISTYVQGGTDGVYTTLVGTFTTSAGQYFMPFLVIAIENCAPQTGSFNGVNCVFISKIEVRKSGGGPNLFARFDPDMHTYIDQKRAYAFDLILAQAEAKGIYLSLALLEKNSNIFQRAATGDVVIGGSTPAAGTWLTQGLTPTTSYFYGLNTDVDHHGRWYQKQWFRYVRARWGYSTAVHSWELLNEGDSIDRHYRLTDVLAGYINQWTLNRHLITTSFFTHRFYGRTALWNNATYTNVSASGRTFVTTHDYIDVAIPETGSFDEPAAISSVNTIFNTSPGMPTGSGETDWNTGILITPEIDSTTNFVWLHNYTWSQLGTRLAFCFPFYYQHTHPSGGDRRGVFGAVRAFLAGLPLNNGNYVGLGVTGTNLKVVGQKDLTNKKAHFWAQAHGTNPYTWKSIDDGLTVTPVTENVVITGLTASASYRVQEYNTATGLVSGSPTTVAANGSGDLTIPVTTSTTSAYQIQPSASVPTITPFFVASVATVYQPSISIGAVQPDFIVSVAVVYAPTITGGGTVRPNFVASTAVVYDPTIVDKTVRPDFLVSTAVVYDPSINGGFILPDFVLSVATVFQPTIGSGVVAPDFVASTAIVYQPSISVGTIILPAFLESGAVVFRPNVSGAAIVGAPGGRTFSMGVSIGIGLGVGGAVSSATGTAPAPAIDARLFVDSFSGSGQLTAHVPDTVWRWGGWFTGGQSTDSWTLSGNNTVRNTANPTVDLGTRQYYAWFPQLTYEPRVSVNIVTPATGIFKCGVIVRMLNVSNAWCVRLNSTNNHLEILRLVGGGLAAVSAFADMGTLANSAIYPLVVTAIGNTITASCNGFQATYASASQNPTASNVGIFESVTSDDGHASFSNFAVEMSNPDTAPTRIVNMPSDAATTAEWDAISTIGTASAARSTINGNGRTSLNILANGSTSGYFLQFYGDATKRVPTPSAPHWIKNLPDEAYYTCYYWFPAQVQRLGTFWNIFQWRQRAADSTTYPVYSLDIGWTTNHMHFELDSAIGANGAIDTAAPEPAPEHYDVPIGRWVKIEAFYRWNTTNGRIIFWLDNQVMWDLQNIKTQFSAGINWTAPSYPRVWGPCHHSDNLGAGSKIIHIDNANFSYLRQADNYPTGAPV